MDHFVTCQKLVYTLLKPGLRISRKDHKHMFAKTFFKLSSSVQFNLYISLKLKISSFIKKN